MKLTLEIDDSTLSIECPDPTELRTSSEFSYCTDKLSQPNITEVITLTLPTTKKKTVTMDIDYKALRELLKSDNDNSTFRTRLVVKTEGYQRTPTHVVLGLYKKTK
jgi:hypothetical protein